MIPDKVYEIGLPLLFLFFLLNAVVSIYRIKSEERIKREAINKGFSEQTLTEMFKEDRLLNKYVYVKWFLILFSVGLSLLVLHFLAYATAIRSGYLSLSVITIFLSGAFFIYYRIIKDK